MAEKRLTASIFPYYGGKGYLMWRHIVPVIESIPHRIYVEPFGGAANILIRKRPSPTEVFNDIDQQIVSFFLVLSDPDLFQQFVRRVSALPYSRALYNQFRTSWPYERNPVKRAVKWFYVARLSFSGRVGNSFRFSRTITGTESKDVASWLSCLAKLPQFHYRLRRAIFECCDFQRIFQLYDGPETLFYCDPPYHPQTRSKPKVYRHEMSHDDHVRLLETVVNCQGNVILSGYSNPLYDETLANYGWTKRTFTTVCNAVGRTRNSGLQGKGNVTAKQKRTECLWIKHLPDPYHKTLFQGMQQQTHDP